MVNNTFTVTSFVGYLKKLVDGDFNIQNIYLKGEISKVTVSPNGHCYFDLKDQSATISCVCFRGSYLKSEKHIKTGNKVVCFGSATVYAATSRLQFNVLDCKADGIGDLYQQFEILKQDLAKRGLFNPEHKIECVEYPEKIAVVVGKDSAAYTDIVATFKRRWPLAKVDYYFSLVQGKEAHLDIIQNLIKIDSLGYDAIILARGGGSIEDLWCFNEASLAEVIYDLDTFIVTGVGHEIDTTIVDYVSDLRANTPTAAVELITPDIEDLLADIAYTDDYLTKLMHDKINFWKNNLLVSANVFKSFDLIINNFKEQINRNLLKIDNSFNRLIIETKNDLNILDSSLDTSIKYLIDSNKKSVNRLDILLDAFSPLNVLDRGFAIASMNGQIIKRIDKIKVDDELNIQFKDGSIKVQVKEKENG